MTDIRRIWFGGLVLALLSPTLPLSATQPAKHDDPNSGRMLYLEHCSSCHGANGLGDGPAARTLRTPLPDLTRLSERRGGLFPTEEVTRIVDGRSPLPGHLRDNMPLWGAIFERLEAGNEKAASTRIDAVVAYLKSLQRARADLNPTAPAIAITRGPA